MEESPQHILVKRDYCPNTFDPLGYIAFLMIGFQLTLNIVNVAINNNNNNNNNNNDNNNNNNNNNRRSFAFPPSHADFLRKAFGKFQPSAKPRSKCRCNKRKRAAQALRTMLQSLSSSRHNPECLGRVGCEAGRVAREHLLVTGRRLAGGGQRARRLVESALRSISRPLVGEDCSAQFPGCSSPP
nr:metabotropic glutamate receptor-like protein R [Penaeus vannamei]